MTFLKDGRRQTLAEYEKSLIQDYKRRSQQNLNLTWTWFRFVELCEKKKHVLFFLLLQICFCQNKTLCGLCVDYGTSIATQNDMKPKAQRWREKTIVQSIIDGAALWAIMANILGRDLLSEQRSFPSNKYWPPSAGLFSLLKIELNFIEEENIAKGTSDPLL